MSCRLKLSAGQKMTQLDCQQEKTTEKCSCRVVTEPVLEFLLSQFTILLAILPKFGENYGAPFQYCKFLISPFDHPHFARAYQNNQFFCVSKLLLLFPARYVKKIA